MTELCPECSETLEVPFVELHTRVETTGCVTCAEALSRFVRAAAAVEVDESVEFGTVPVSGMVPVSGLAAWRQQMEWEHAMALADRELAGGEVLNVGAYGVDAIVVGVGETHIPQATPRDPYLGDTIANIMKKEVVLTGRSSGTKNRKGSPNSLAREQQQAARYNPLVQSER